ncbi:hypothetical protein MNBD_GAMMA05-840 [hydrothermal vent metagenome]|uniref:Lipoprotein n=1 Tax=hydrothermal vent metagenome TaxID=652676 RepID=A0A3B0W5Z6_9ZZZZ
MGRILKILITIYLTFIISACATTTVNTYSIDGKETICNGKNVNLGSVVILPEVAWRKNQKEPKKREEVALNEIKNAFKNISCGKISLFDGVKDFSNWSGIVEQELLTKFSDEKFDTVIIIRIEELTPRLSITFSIPFLWSGSNEVVFHIKVISVKTGKILNDMRIQRVTGGLFHIRPAEWSKDELYLALQQIIK